MQKYLSNLALILINQFCKDNNIDISDTHLEKQPRKQHYTLVKNNEQKQEITSITLYTHQTPQYYIYNN